MTYPDPRRGPMPPGAVPVSGPGYPGGQPAPPPGYPGNFPHHLPPQAGWPPPPPPKKKGLPAWGIILIVLGGFVVLLCAGGAILVGVSGGSSAGPKPTVHVTSCEYDGVIATYMNYTLTNNDSRPHDYFIEGTVGHSPAIPDVLKNVGPHETVSGKLMGADQGDCAITRVDQQ